MPILFSLILLFELPLADIITPVFMLTPLRHAIDAAFSFAAFAANTPAISPAQAAIIAAIATPPILAIIAASQLPHFAAFLSPPAAAARQYFAMPPAYFQPAPSRRLLIADITPIRH
jgi:hypothetical protein